MCVFQTSARCRHVDLSCSLQWTDGSCEMFGSLTSYLAKVVHLKQKPKIENVREEFLDVGHLRYFWFSTLFLTL